MITTWLSSIARCHRIVIRRTIFPLLIAICGLMSWTRTRARCRHGQVSREGWKICIRGKHDSPPNLLLSAPRSKALSRRRNMRRSCGNRRNGPICCPRASRVGTTEGSISP